MRMPGTGDTGAYILDATEGDPSGGLTSFTATWHAHLSPADTGDGEVVLQLLAPTDGDPDRADVRLWIARHRHWEYLRSWQGIGPDWVWKAAPIIAAAITPRTTRVQTA